jgi:hypothetical protein
LPKKRLAAIEEATVPLEEDIYKEPVMDEGKIFVLALFLRVAELFA